MNRAEWAVFGIVIAAAALYAYDALAWTVYADVQDCNNTWEWFIRCNQNQVAFWEQREAGK